MLGRSDELGRREGECGAWRLGGQRSSADLLDLPFTFSELGPRTDAVVVPYWAEVPG
jgi:hypothetical protein